MKLISGTLFFGIFFCNLYHHSTLPAVDQAFEINQTFSSGVLQWKYQKNSVPYLIPYNKTGEKIFRRNCAYCHAVERDMVGPALKNIESRRSKEWLYKMITNSKELIKSGDPAAIELYEKFNRVRMPAHQLSMAQVDSLLAYLKFASYPENGSSE